LFVPADRMTRYTRPAAARNQGETMVEPVLQPEIHELIEQKNFSAIKAAIRDMEVHDLVELLTTLEGEDLAVAFRLLPANEAADIFGDLELEQQEALLETLKTEKMAAILNDMPPDERTELLEELPGELAQRILNTLRGEQLQIARNLLAYPEDSIGRLMTPEYLSVRADWSVAQVLEHVRKVGRELETINVLYVTDDHGRLLDDLQLEQLVLADPDERVRGLMDEQVASLLGTDDQESSIEVFTKYEAVALPVVDNRNVLVGIVTVDDVIEVAEEEGTEDFQRMAGMGALEASYFSTGFWAMLGKRLPWLAMLLCAQTLTTVALLGFDKLPLFAVLVVFVPLINSPAGNTGTQMAGLMIRGLAVAEVELRDWLRVLVRELLNGVTLGVALGGLGFVAARVFSAYVEVPSGGLHVNPLHVATSVALAITVAVTAANIIGSMLPFFFKRVGLDPAVTSGPFIASLMDVTGIMTYFSIAGAVLAMMT
jgi:magnesium transporter